MVLLARCLQNLTWNRCSWQVYNAPWLNCITGKQAAYLDFDFGGRIHHTETLKKAGKSATWEHPVQLTGAGVNMKVCLPLWEDLVSICCDGMTKGVPVQQQGNVCMLE